MTLKDIGWGVFWLAAMAAIICLSIRDGRRNQRPDCPPDRVIIYDNKLQRHLCVSLDDLKRG